MAKTKYTVIDEETKAALKYAVEHGLIDKPKDLCVSSDEEEDEDDTPVS